MSVEAASIGVVENRIVYPRNIPCSSRFLILVIHLVIWAKGIRGVCCYGDFLFATFGKYKIILHQVGF